MLVRNKSGRQVSLARTVVNDDLSVAALVVSSHYRAQNGALDPLREVPVPTPADPPDRRMIALWRGVSVTAAGDAYCPVTPPFVRPVALRVGPEIRRLLVFGDRRWTRGNDGGLSVTAPAKFDPMPLSFSRAFGGSHELGPGLFPGTDLPMPRLQVAYPLNPAGVGFYESVASAEDQLLPNIELPDQLVQRVDDRPEPAGFSSCPELPALRLTEDTMSSRDGQPPRGLQPLSIEQRLSLSLRALHHAPGRLIFARVPVGTEMTLDGLGAAASAIRFEVPRSPIRVGIRRGRGDEEIAPSLRSVHIDARSSVVSLVHAHTFHHHPERAPDWVRVIARGSV
ncbi:DUF2169 domain-containing protein [Chondromyces crocatus]|uniref:DUF2169 domain-containing protein n=1 Tax=Chondromyces crocatus TaxID=52 RepID=A0A0K1EG99_CHOCO|nr:DUF2169 domain-containing protein [Chondromyces crocatus]AKT39707.1 uncharacterized protein CMC5_038560 [Chondromyces crocatus]